MKSLEESVVEAMDGSAIELFPYLPYILQDLWEIGACPEVIIELIRKHGSNYSDLSILDLGCGKGVVSVKVAKEFECTCFGIDAVKGFIDEANTKAKDFGVNHLCTFEVGDIREKIDVLKHYDIVILGAIGPIFGDYYSTLNTLAPHLNENGIIIIDDGYLKDDNDTAHPSISTKEIILEKINDVGMQLIDEAVITEDEIAESDDYIFSSLKKRCIELIEKYPDKSELFNDYIERQEEENYILENKVICSTMVIVKRL